MSQGVASWLDPIMAGLPIVVLIWMMTRKKSFPAWQALPASAALLYLIKLFYFGDGLVPLNAAALSGVLYAFTPLMVIWGAITMFLAMQACGCMEKIKVWLGGITPNKTAQLMLIGWAFSFLMEGASGFGTPIALAAPLLVGLGFEPVKTAIFCILMNSAPVSFGAVGTPTWFGLSALNLGQEEVLRVGFASALMHSAACLVVSPAAVWIMQGREELRKNFVFVMLSIVSCLLPYALLAKLNYEFPSIIGGALGLALTAFMARHGIGLAKEPGQDFVKGLGKVKMETVWAFMPIWGSIATLLLTRIKQFELKPLLVMERPALKIALGGLGDFSISPALVMKLSDILRTGQSWEQKTLFIPGVIPFIMMSLLAFAAFRPGWGKSAAVFKDSFARVKTPCVALLGALMLVKLLMLGGDKSCAMVLGRAFGDLAGRAWVLCAPFLGALGAFFAGSNTVSNLTFGGIQLSIAKTLGLDVTLIVALQSVGGAMGHMVCLHNIVTVAAILGIPTSKEGEMLRKTFLPMVVYGLIAVAAGLALSALGVF